MDFDGMVSVIVDAIIETKRQVAFEYEDGNREGEYLFSFPDKIVRDKVATELVRNDASVQPLGDTQLIIQI